MQRTNPPVPAATRRTDLAAPGRGPDGAPTSGIEPPQKTPLLSNLLVPLDGTPEAAVALAPAQALARATGARLTLMRVLVDEPADPNAVAYLRRIGTALAAEGTDGEVVVRPGEAAATILDEARQRRCELIVMATHGRIGVVRALLGSVAEGVLTDGRTPVLLVRPGGHPVSAVRTLLVPLDGSPGGAVALGPALGLARATGAGVVLLQVIVPLAPYAGLGWEGTDAWPWDPRWDEEAMRAARGYVDGMARRLRRVGVAAEGQAVFAEPEQDPAAAINAATERVDADVVVMSTHALTGPARALVGSVADEVVRTGRRGVLLIRRDAPFVDRSHQPAPAGRPA